jgi:hypothetical protein
VTDTKTEFRVGDRVEIDLGYDDGDWNGYPGVVSDTDGGSILVTTFSGLRGYFSSYELRPFKRLVEVETRRTIRIFGRWIQESEARQLLRELDEVLS